MIGSLRLQTDARAVVEPETPAFWLFGGHFQPLTSPDPLDTLLVHRPASSAKQRRDPAISVATILAGKLDDVGRQRVDREANLVSISSLNTNRACLSRPCARFASF